MDSSHAPTLGIVELPELAEVLRQLGFRIITAPTFVDAASAVKNEIDAALERGDHNAARFPILIADVHRPGIKAWSQRLASTSPVLLLRGPNPDDDYNIAEGSRSMRLPSTVGDALYNIGFPTPADDRLSWVINPDGHIPSLSGASGVRPSATPTPAPAEPFDSPWNNAAPQTGQFPGFPGTAPAQPAFPPAQAPAAPQQQFPAQQAPAQPAFPPAQAPVAPAPAQFQAPAERAPWDARPATGFDQPQPVDPSALERPAQTLFPDPQPVQHAPAPWTQPAAQPAPWAAAPVEQPGDQFTHGRRSAESSEQPTAPSGWPSFAETTAPAAEPVIPISEIPAWGTPAAPVAADQPAPWTQPAQAQAPATPAWTQPAAEPVQEAPAWTQPAAELVQEAPAWGIPAAEAAPVAPAAPAATAAAAPGWNPTPSAPDGSPSFPRFPSGGAEQPAVESPSWASTPAQETPAPAAAAPVFTEPVAPAAPKVTPYIAPITTADDIFEQAAASPASLRGRGPAAPVIFDWAYKGGVNKTSITLQLAHRGAANGIRVVCVDMNRGQGGIRTMLRIADDAPIRSAFDASATGDPSRAIVLPDEIAKHRSSTLEPIDFGVVLAPPRAEADMNQASWAVYKQIIDHARHTADLVIVDTQTVEATDNSGLIDHVMVPTMIQDGGWGLAITEFAKESVENLLAAFEMYEPRGLTRDRQLLAVTRVQGFTSDDAYGVEKKFGRYAKFAGTTAVSAHLKDQLDRGRIVSDDPAVRPLLDSVLLQVTGNPVFAPADDRPKKRSLFGGGRK